MSFLASRASVLRKRPLVVGTLTGADDFRAQLKRAASPLVDILELRLDTFPSIHGPATEGVAAGLLSAAKKARKPILLTLRSHTERGSVVPAAERLTDAERERLILPLLRSVRLVDVEARHPAFARRISAAARRAGVDVIHSYHDFSGAGLKGLNRWVSRSRAGGADVFKIAMTPRRPGELEAFLKWGMSLRMPRVLIGMGDDAAISRVVGFSFGSILTYGHLGRSAAPGQMAAAELGRMVRQVYPGRPRK